MGTATYDKYEGYANGFRAHLKDDWLDSAKLGVPFGVGLDGNGLLVPGAGTSGIVGILVVNKKFYAGDRVDVMTSGEIVGVDTWTKGAKYYADNTTGAVTTTSAGGTKLGFIVTGLNNRLRLIVRTVW